MVYGILKDRKEGECRVITTPTDAAAIIERGHRVIIERGAGEAAGFPDEKYKRLGVTLSTREEIFSHADLVAKVKEFTSDEINLARKGQILLGCLHPAANPEEVRALLESECIAFTAEDSHRYGSPNCEAAGKMGALFGIESMLTVNGGKGIYVGGLAAAPRMRALILGAGQVGEGALSVLHALGADCTVMDINLGILREMSYKYRGIDTAISTVENIAAILPKTDMVINCVKWQKERRDFLISRKMLSLLERGSVIVDISGDDPGAIETSHPTTLKSPRYTVDGVVHFCVSNIPSAVARSASIAYSAEMLPFVLSLLDLGVKGSCAENGYLRRSMTVYNGYLTHEETSALQGIAWIRPEEVLGLKNGEYDIAPRQSKTRSDNTISLRM